VTLDRQVNDAPRRVGHQAAHPRQLGDRAKAALRRAGKRHDRNRPERVQPVADHVIQIGLGAVPTVNRDLVALFFGEQAAPKIALRRVNGLLGRIENVVALRGHSQV